MTPTKSEKTFDCLRFKQQAQDALYQVVQDLPPAAEIEYIRQRALVGPFGQQWQALKQESADKT